MERTFSWIGRCRRLARDHEATPLVGWARRGSRPRQPADQLYGERYLFGAICPARVRRWCCLTPTPNHATALGRNRPQGGPKAHAVLLLDRAGWRTTGCLVVPKNLTLIFLPSRAPELNPVENAWQFLRANWLLNQVFETYEAIIEAACKMWRRLMSQSHIITSMGMRDWAHIGQN